jgi:hypothetical protein
MKVTDEVLKRVALELEQAAPIKSQIPCFEAFAVMGALQLACRHPRLLAPVRPVVEKAARDLQAAIALRAPLAGELLEDGWNEALDEVEIDPPEVR